MKNKNLKKMKPFKIKNLKIKIYKINKFSKIKQDNKDKIHPQQNYKTLKNNFKLKVLTIKVKINNHN